MTELEVYRNALLRIASKVGPIGGALTRDDMVRIAREATQQYDHEENDCVESKL